MTDGELFVDGEMPGDESVNKNRDGGVAEEEILVGEVFEVPGDTAGTAETTGIGQLRRERDEYLDALRRLQADFENFRKRTIRQQTEMLEQASVSLLERLLPVLDALDLALVHSDAKGEEVSDNDLSMALAQIAGLARAVVEKEGLERIADTGVVFDPTIHDAVSHVPAQGDQSGQTVIEVMRPGYRLKGKVIRPAMVAVAG